MIFLPLPMGEGTAAAKAVRSQQPPGNLPLLPLERQLREGSYRPGRYVEILVRDPKERLVSAAPFRDRVVHHALCAVCAPIFEAGFIGNTFANRTGKGTHKAIEAYERYRDRSAHVLRCDIFRYFPSLDHAILKAEFRRRIEPRRDCRRLPLLRDWSHGETEEDIAEICAGGA